LGWQVFTIWECEVKNQEVLYNTLRKIFKY
jgi:G:T-mismatch repair DNA endonuclease (very short patch repair protein)